MKKVLHHALINAMAIAMALATAPVLAAPVTEELNAVELENRAADVALNAMAVDIVQKYGKDAAPAVLASRLSALRALCQGVDPARLAQAMNGGAKPAKPKALRVQTMELQQVKIKHPLCRPLTAQAI